MTATAATGSAEATWTSPPRRRESVEPGDGALVRAMLAGDTGAAQAIWRRYAPTVRSTVRGALGPDQETEDLLQDVFVRFLKAAPTLESADALKPFLTSIALRTVASEIRRRRVRRIVGLRPPEDLPEQTSPAPDHAARQAVTALYRVLDRLRTRSRFVFVLRYVEGLSHREIGEILGLSTVTVKRELVRVSEKLEGALSHEPALQAYRPARAVRGLS